MAKIIVYHFSERARVPALSEAQCRDIRARFDAAIARYPGVVFHGVFVDEHGQGICEWDAPDVQTVRSIITQVDGHPPVDPVLKVDRLL